MDEHRNKLLLLRTPVAVIPSDWSDLIDRRAVFNPDYGIVVGYSQKNLVNEQDGSERTIDATDIQLKKGDIVSIAGFELDGMGAFDKDGFWELIKEEVKGIDKKIEGLRFKIEESEEPVKNISETNAPVKGFWLAQIASWKQSVRFLSKKKGRLEDLGRKVEKKLEKMKK